MTDYTHALPGPADIVRRELPNGIVVLVRENHQAQSVVLTGSLDAGSLFDPLEFAGIASFTASALMRGTQQRDFATIHELLEGNGASLAISSGMHTVGFSGKSLGEDLPLLVDLLADALRRPSFPDNQVERLRGEIITALRIREQDTRYMAGRLFRTLAYPATHPYSRPADGDMTTIARITREQLIAYRDRHFGPRGMIVVIVGAVQAERAIELIAGHFGDWHNDQQPDPPQLIDTPRLDATREQSLAMSDKSQTDIVLGVPGPTRFAADWQAANMANNILGVFGMYGRIGTEVREKRGLAYYSFSRINGGLGPGSWRVIAGVAPANVQQAVEAIRGEIRRLTSEPVKPDELADNKANFTGRLPLQLESNEGVAGTILTMERYDLGLDYLWRYPDIINSISVEDVLAAAQHYLNPDVYALAIAGPDGSAETG